MKGADLIRVSIWGCLLFCPKYSYSQGPDSSGNVLSKIRGQFDSSRKINFQIPGLIKGNHPTILKFKLLPTFGGKITVEAYHTSFQNPRVLNAPTYLRISGSSNVSWFGVPLILDFYKTSESQSIYNSNYFRLSFDKTSFLSQFSKDWKTSLNKAQENLAISKIGQQETAKLEKVLVKEKDELRNQEDRIKLELESKRKAYLLKYQKQYDSVYQLVKDSLNKSIDSVHSSIQSNIPKKEQVRDSLGIDKLHGDSLKLAETAYKWHDRYITLIQKRRTLDSTISADSAKIAIYKELIQDPEKHMRDWLRGHGLPKQLLWLSSINDFQMGVVNPTFHPYSIYGVGIKGLNTSFKVGNLDLDLAGGKAIIADLSNYSRQNSKYERLFLGIAGKFDLSIGQLQIFSHFTQDPQRKFSKNGRPAYQSFNAGVDFKTQIFKVTGLDIALASGQSTIINREIRSTTYPTNSTIGQITSLRAGLAHLVHIDQQIIKTLQLDISDQFVGPKFRNFGNPFMRTNFREQQAKLKASLFHQQLNIATFYKTFRDNPLSILEITNRTSGYGLSMATRFKNKHLPNFNASVTPYEQGNNHPDSLFRINSKYAIVSAGMNYHTGRGRMKYFVLINGSQSQMAFNDSFSSRVQSLNANQEITLGKYLSLGNSVAVVRTWPMVDSIQMNVFQGRIAFRAAAGNQILLNLQYSQYLNGAYRKGISLSSAIKFKKSFRLTLRTGYDLYYRIWGIYRQQAFSGLARMEFSF